MMPTTKKLLVRFDETNNQLVSGDFLIPRYEGSKIVLKGVISGIEAKCGAVVYIGKDINENDLFARLVDSGCTIDNVSACLEILKSYVEQLATFKIGNIVQHSRSSASQSELNIELVANSPPSL